MTGPHQMYSEDDFPQLLEDAKCGDQSALSALYRLYNPMLLRYLYTQVGNEAEDIASEVWISAARGLPRFEGDQAGLKSWLFTITRRRITDLRRHQARHRTDLLAPESFDSYASAEDLAGSVTESMDARAALAQIAAHLPPEQAEVLVLRIVADFDVAETARIMGKRPGAVRVLQHRALAKLRKILPVETVTP